MKNKKVLTVIARGFLLMGLIFTVIGMYLLVRAYSIPWQSVDAEVIATTVQLRRVGVQDPRHRVREYYPKITYRYRVGNSFYTTAKYSLYGEHDKTIDKAAARRQAAKYPSGKKLVAFYDKNNPATAVLDNGIGWESYAALLLGLLCCGCGWGVQWLSRLPSKADISQSGL